MNIRDDVEPHSNVPSIRPRKHALGGLAAVTLFAGIMTAALASHAASSAHTGAAPVALATATAIRATAATDNLPLQSSAAVLAATSVTSASATVAPSQSKAAVRTFASTHNAGLSPTPTATPKPTPVPPVQLITNAEVSTPSVSAVPTGWTESPVDTTTWCYCSGQLSVVFYPSPSEPLPARPSSTISQTFTIPLNASRVTLSFSETAVQMVVPENTPIGSFSVSLTHVGQTTTLMALPSTANVSQAMQTMTFVPETVDLTPYRGMTVTLTFTGAGTPPPSPAPSVLEEQLFFHVSGISVLAQP